MERTRHEQLASPSRGRERHREADSPLSKPQKRRRRLQREAVRKAHLASSSIRATLEISALPQAAVSPNISIGSDLHARLDLLDGKINQVLAYLEAGNCFGHVENCGDTCDWNQSSVQAELVLSHLNPHAPAFKPGSSVGDMHAEEATGNTVDSPADRSSHEHKGLFVFGGNSSDNQCTSNIGGHLSSKATGSGLFGTTVGSDMFGNSSGGNLFGAGSGGNTRSTSTGGNLFDSDTGCNIFSKSTWGSVLYDSSKLDSAGNYKDVEAAVSNLSQSISSLNAKLGGLDCKLHDLEGHSGTKDTLDLNVGHLAAVGTSSCSSRSRLKSADPSTHGAEMSFTEIRRHVAEIYEVDLPEKRFAELWDPAVPKDTEGVFALYETGAFDKDGGASWDGGSISDVNHNAGDDEEEEGVGQEEEEEDGGTDDGHCDEAEDEEFLKWERKYG